MKTVRNGLLALALAYCGCKEKSDTNNMPSLTDLAEEMPINREYATIDVNVNLSNGWTSSNCIAEIELSNRGYEISTDVLCGSIKFKHMPYENRDILYLGIYNETAYHDIDIDGIVDYVELDGTEIKLRDIPENYRAKINKRYNDILAGLKNNSVSEVWTERWRR